MRCFKIIEDLGSIEMSRKNICLRHKNILIIFAETSPREAKLIKAKEGS